MFTIVFFFSFVVVFLCLGLTVFSTIPDNEYEEDIGSALFNLEVVVVIWFGLEFIIRYYSCTSKKMIELIYNSYTT